MAVFHVVLEDDMVIRLERSGQDCKLSIDCQEEELGYVVLSRESLASLHLIVEAMELTWRE